MKIPLQHKAAFTSSVFLNLPALVLHYIPVRDRRGRPTYLGYGQLGIASVGKNEGNGLTTKKSEVLISPNIHKNRATFKNEKEMTASVSKPNQGNIK